MTKKYFQQLTLSTIQYLTISDIEVISIPVL